MMNELGIGSEFTITTEFTITPPTDGTKPQDYVSIKPVGGLVDPNSGTFVDVHKLGKVGAPEVRQVSKKKVGDENFTAVTYRVTERFKITEGTCKSGGTCGISFRVVVTDPTTRDEMSIRSVNAPTLFDKRPQTISVRNVPAPIKKGK